VKAGENTAIANTKDIQNHSLIFKNNLTTDENWSWSFCNSSTRTMIIIWML